MNTTRRDVISENNGKYNETHGYSQITTFNVLISTYCNDFPTNPIPSPLQSTFLWLQKKAHFVTHLHKSLQWLTLPAG